MTTTTTTIRLLAAATMAVIILLLPSHASAQETGDNWARWWYGVYGGVNINLFNGAMHDLGTSSDTNVARPTGFTGGSGLGLGIGGLLEYNSGKLLGGNLFIGYDNRRVKFDTKNVTRDTLTGRANETLTTGLAYLTIEPNLRINIANRFFHVMVGPTFAINVSKGYEFGFQDTAGVNITRSQELANVRGFVIGMQGGLGYDIPLQGPNTNTQIMLTPFAQFHVGQGLIETPTGGTNDFGLNTIRLGVELKFGSPASAVINDGGDNVTSFTVKAPNVITDSRRLQETFPMRNYIFFDAASTDLPDRYKKLSKSDASSFREEQLVRPNVETGASDAMQVRSRRQMEVYYNVLNVFGDRLRRNPSASIALSGAANGNATAGKQMAENVKSYLTTTFGIDPSRITTTGKAMPTHKSGTGSSQGEDRKLLDDENYRVEVEATPANLLQPVNIMSMQDEPIDNDIIFSINPDPKLASWSIEITDRDGGAKTFGPYTGQNVIRVDSKSLIGTRREGRYKAKIISLWKDGKKTTSDEQEFRLVRSDEDQGESGTRYSILFEFDDSKTVETYKDFLIGTVAPAIPDGASVIIHGHTDISGDPDYNQKLSQRRCDAAREILAAELTRLNRNVTFDSYGFGEDERRSPFNNTLAEQRYYNRTVVIEVVPR